MEIPGDGYAGRLAMAPAAQALAWWQEISPPQWRAFRAAYFAWVLDAFDFTILTFLLADIGRSFDVSKTLAGALGTVTLMSRLCGGVAAGVASDRWGRKWPLVLSVVWYSVFAGLGGFAPSYALLFVCRALFGIGMGGTWAAGIPLAIEHWPAHLRGRLSGLVQSGFSAGFILAACAYHLVSRFAGVAPELEWRVLLWIGILPVGVALWIAWRVDESPLWLSRHTASTSGEPMEVFSVVRLFRRDLRWTTLHCAAVMAALLCLYYAIAFWYPTLLVQQQRTPLPFMVALNLGTLLGEIAWGRASETAIGRRGALVLATAGGLLVAPLYVSASSPVTLIGAAFAMGVFGCGGFGIVPTYLSERYPTDVRAAGAGFCYHAGAAVSALMPVALGALQEAGVTLADAMLWGIVGLGVLTMAVMWVGPETRGVTLTAGER